MEQTPTMFQSTVDKLQFVYLGSFQDVWGDKKAKRQLKKQ